MEDAYSVITGKNGGADSQLVRFFFSFLDNHNLIWQV
jgi:hypothetical protein